MGVVNNLTAGVGINRGGIYFDYAYHRYGNVAENTTHFFSISYKLGELKQDKIKEEVKTETPLPPVPVLIPNPAPVPEAIAPKPVLLKVKKPAKAKPKAPPHPKHKLR